MTRGLLRSISILFRCTVQYRDKKLSQYGITGPQAPFITVICNNPGITQDRIAQNLHINRSNVTRQLAALETNGFVERKRSEADHRTVEVYPTEQAKNIFPVVMQVFSFWKNALTDDMSAEELAALEQLMDRLSRKAERLE